MIVFPANVREIVFPAYAGIQTSALDSGFRRNDDDKGVLRFEQAEFVVSDADTPPQAGWKPQRLPDSWLRNHPGLAGIGWYRMQFRLDALPPAGTALYVSRVAVTGQLWLNGSILNPEVRFTQPDGPVGTSTSHRAYLIPLPQGLFRVGENTVHVRVQGFGVGGEGLWDVRIGDIERLRPAWLVREIPQRIIPQALFALMLASSLFAFLVWWRERHARIPHFMIVMLLWTVFLGMFVLPPPPLTRFAWTTLIVVLLTVFNWTLLHLFYRYSESRWRWYPNVLHAVAAITLLLAVAIVVNADPDHGSRQMGLLMIPTALLRVLATAMLLQAAWRQRSWRSYALAGTEILWFSGQLQIMGILMGWLSPEPFRIDPACALPLYLVLQYFFVERFVREREQAAREQQEAIIAERARILQDMHDGMGSQLVTALRLVKREDGDRVIAARNIEEALQDLRLIIDSLDDVNQGLLPKLADLRYRLEPRLAELGIRLVWAVEPLPELEGLSPQSALNAMRIVQEALNNAVKHARPTAITVSATRQNGKAVIAVEDDGSGFDLDATGSRGRGLSGMRKRADQIGASLHLERRDGGAAVSLHFPPASGLQPRLGAP
ncbi:MAG TPA: ATP-binding protein [Burkholderiales bacterium]|nr:ATP-binding protein [Burkholderiales bacterium]